ncbi:MAG: ATP synthase F1 subunit gamma [Nitrospiraceae bacterium]|jgi:F-type H+-transporting ATPase subunit gamma|nr:MAG: ATP synthase F1 subunit gamma [Nitrospiraceae bacterium]
MATLRDIQKRIKAVENTKKITKAMKMVAAAKLRKVQTRMLDLRPYADKMHEVLASLAKGADRESHPLLSFRPRKTVEVVVVTSDRGLCGAFNTNILKAAQGAIDNYKNEGFEVSISTIGKKARDYFKRRDMTVRHSWTGISGNVRYSSAEEIANDIKEHYMNETIDEVTVVYNSFKSMVAQDVTTVKLLPLTPEEGEKEAGADSAADFIYEPSMEAIFDRLIPRNVDIQIYRALLESSASEEAARMSAMENATQSCTEMVETLTLQFNKARQAAITGELMDIVGGVEALKG